MTQCEKEIRHMTDFDGITTFEAFTEYGITRLPSRICDLRKTMTVQDEVVNCTNRYREPVHYKRYFLEGSNA